MKILNDAPNVNIIEPAPPVSFLQGTPVSFVAELDDDIDLAEDLTVLWTSHLDGALVGEAWSAEDQAGFGTVALSAGDHLITVEVLDSSKESATDSLEI